MWFDARYDCDPLRLCQCSPVNDRCVVKEFRTVKTTTATFEMYRGIMRKVNLSILDRFPPILCSSDGSVVWCDGMVGGSGPAPGSARCSGAARPASARPSYGLPMYYTVRHRNTTPTCQIDLEVKFQGLNHGSAQSFRSNSNGGWVLRLDIFT
jgi:hypothetical protein